MGIITSMYSFKGRVGRLGYLGRAILYTLVIILFIVALAFVNSLFKDAIEAAIGALIQISTITAIALFAFLFFAYLYMITTPFLALICKRLHDIGLSGWWQILIPLFVILYIGFIVISFSPINFMAVLTDIQEGDTEALIRGLFSILTPDNINTIQYGAIALNVINIIYALFLLFWPGTDGPNKYDDFGSNGATKDTTKKHFYAVLKEPVPEASLYLFKNIKMEYPDILSINLPKERNTVDITLSGKSYNKASVKKMLHGLGIMTKSVIEKPVLN